MDWKMDQRTNWLNFVKDPLAYIVVVFLIGPYIAFTVGAYLPDYDSSDYEATESARNALQGLGACFIIICLISNLQVTIILLTVAVVVTTILAVAVVLSSVLLSYLLLMKVQRSKSILIFSYMYIRVPFHHIT